MSLPTSPVSIGATVTEGPKEYGWGVSRGYFTKRVWKGTQSEIQALLPQLQLAGYDYTVTEGPVWTVTATIGQDASDGSEGGQTEIPIPTFELFSERREMDLFESTCPLTIACKPELLREVKKSAVNDNAPVFLTGSTFTQQEKNTGMSLYVHYIAGAKTYTQNFPVLRKAYSISNNYYVAANTLYGANFIWSTNGVVATEGVPAAIQGLMPPSTTFTTTDGIPYIVGWLKGYPTYNQQAVNRFQVNVDYIFGSWPAYIYGNPPNYGFIG